MICCQKKAIVKYKRFKNGGFKYRLNVNWISVKANEPLIAKCKGVALPGVYYSVGCGFDGFSCNPFCKGPITWIGNNQIQTGDGIAYFNGAAVGRNCNGDINISPSFGGPIKYDFLVIGETSGNEYVSISNLDQCPEWQQEGCQLQEEQSFEIELYSIDLSFIKKIPGFSALPLPTVMSECVFAQSGVPLTGPHCLLIKRQASIPINIFNLIQGKIGTPFESVAKVLCSDEGCPPPQVVITCDDDDKDKECPPETDCEIECKGFKCCYHKGKVIKTIPL